MVIYFSGTGNSEFVAKQIGKALDDIAVNAFEYIKENREFNGVSEKPWIFVSPVYGWRLPRVFEDFIKRGSFKGNNNAYTVITCGSDIGNSEKYVEKLLFKHKLNNMGTWELLMPENYSILFPIPNSDKIGELIESSKGQITDLTNLIIKSEPMPSKRINILDKVKSTVINPIFYKFIVKDKKFKVKGNCNLCGICSKVCPLNNITYNNKKPDWNGNCTHCLACITNCPITDIEYGKRTIKKVKYNIKNYIK